MIDLADFKRQYLDHEIDFSEGGEAPDFNEWVKALENDPEYLEKREQELDEELGKDRIF